MSDEKELDALEKTPEFQDGYVMRANALRFEALYGKNALLAWLYALIAERTGLPTETVLPDDLFRQILSKRKGEK